MEPLKFDAAAWMAEMDTEGRIIALKRRVRMARYMPVRPAGEPSLAVVLPLLIALVVIGALGSAVVL